MKTNWFSRFGSAGAAAGVAKCPACIPALSALLSSIGVSLTVGRAILTGVTALLLIIGLIGLYTNMHKHGKKIFSILGFMVSIAIFASRYLSSSNATLYSGAAVLLVNAFLDFKYTKKSAVCCRSEK